MPILDKKIFVPDDATARGIIANTKLAFEQAGLPITHFDERLEAIVDRDLESVRGKKLNVLMHNFGRGWESQETREFQEPLMFDGNGAACLVWAAETKPFGRFISIYNDKMILCAPYFDRDDVYRRFYRFGVRNGWFDSTFSVSFQVISVL